MLKFSFIPWLFVLFLLTGCASQTLSPEQEQDTKNLAVLANYTGNILAAAAVPLRAYCDIGHWPDPNFIDSSQPLLTNLNGLTYAKGKNNTYIATFVLVDNAPGDGSQSTTWEMTIPAPNLNIMKSQIIKLDIQSETNEVALTDPLTFSCHIQKIKHTVTSSGEQYAQD